MAGTRKARVPMAEKIRLINECPQSGMTDADCQPMYDYFHRELLKRSFAMADETRVQVLNEEGRRAQTQSFMWLFRSGEDGLPAIILYG